MPWFAVPPPETPPPETPPPETPPAHPGCAEAVIVCCGMVFVLLLLASALAWFAILPVIGLLQLCGYLS